MTPTRYPGIFQRGERYVVVYRVDGRQRKETVPTLNEARRLKAARTTDVARGEFTDHSLVRLHDYAREWIERYQGTGRRGFREETRGEYRALLGKYALVYFPATARMSEVTPRHVADFSAGLCSSRVDV